MILIDNREPPLTIHNGVQQFGLENVKVDALKTGDVLLHGAVIERKTPSDLINSKISKDKHLDTQAQRMTAYGVRILIVEGDFEQLINNDPRYSWVNMDWYDGVCASLQVNYGLTIKEVKNNKRFWKYVSKVENKLQKRKAIEQSPVYTPKITKKNKSVFLSQICSIPTISESKGLKIKERFKSNRGLCDATLEELMEIEGIGPKLAERIKSSYF